ncbi:MAG: PilZ domain-containing protein [Candidatus Omnitrophica bacterium]|nr:PilZ domain-containing protein [Candidatus Omnitrophota bacterium]
MAKSTGQERRKHSRFTAYHLAKYKLLATEPKETCFCLAAVKDIGAGGIRMRIDKLLPMSSLLELKINFPAFNSPVFVLAKVVWIKSFKTGKYIEYGLQFTEIEEAVSSIIAKRLFSVEEKLKKRNLIYKFAGLFKLKKTSKR